MALWLFQITFLEPWRSRDPTEDSSHMAQLLWALLLASCVWAKEQTFRGQHDLSEEALAAWTPVSEEQYPPRAGMCIKDTSRACRAWHSGSLVDHVTQCIGQGMSINPTAQDTPASAAHSAYCSADMVSGKSQTMGTCICGPGFCADTTLLCHPGTYEVVNDVFTISTKALPQERLYMTPDGKVKMGWPPDPRAAQWRISVTAQGVKLLWTELYTKTILQEYESCTTVADAYGLQYTKCSRIIGHVPNPKMEEAGWTVEMYEDDVQRVLGGGAKNYVLLRSSSTWDIFYISPLTKEGMACEARGRDCPGDLGAFTFDPPLFGRIDFVFDNAPGRLAGGLSFYTVTVIVAVILICCVGCVFSVDKRQRSCIATCLLIPFSTCARQIGFKGGGARI